MSHAGQCRQILLPEDRERHEFDDRFARNRFAEATARTLHRSEGEEADTCARAEGVIGKEPDGVRSTSRSA